MAGFIASFLFVAVFAALPFAAKADMYRAGPRVVIAGVNEGNILAAGGEVRLTGQIKDSARVIGGRVIIAAQIAGDLTALGGSIRVTPATNVAGEAWLAGGYVEVAGWTAGRLRITAGTVVIAGEVAGDVELNAGSVEILPDAVIRGRLVYRSPNPADIDPAARIEGEVVREAELPVAAPETDVLGRMARGIVTIFTIAWTIGLTLLGAVLVAAFPRQTLEAARTISAAPWQSLLLGFALLVATPVAILFLMITLLGMPLGLALLAVYVLSLALGYLTAAFFLGDLALRMIGRGETLDLWWRIGSLVVAILVLGFLGTVPWIGGLVLFAAIILGLGAWYLRLWERYKTV